MKNEKVRLEIPEGLVEKMAALRHEFSDFFDITDSVSAKWNIENDAFIFEMRRNDGSHTVIK